MFQPEVPTTGKVVQVLLTSYIQMQAAAATAACAVLLAVTAAVEGTRGGVTPVSVTALLAMAAIFTGVSEIVWRHVMNQSGFTGMPTKTDAEQIAEYLDLSMTTGVPVTYQQAEQACQFARVLARSQRYRGICAATTLTALPLAWATSTSLALALGQLLAAAVAWVATTIAMKRLQAVHPVERQLIVDLGVGLLAATKSAD